MGRGIKWRLFSFNSFLYNLIHNPLQNIYTLIISFCYRLLCNIYTMQHIIVYEKGSQLNVNN